MPARYLPTAIKDETGAYARQMAQGNQALARLYAQLLARYEERMAAQEFRAGEAEKGRQHQFDILERRYDLIQRNKNAADQTSTVPNPLSRGAAAHPRSSQVPPTAATPQAPATAAPPATSTVPPHLKPMPDLGNKPPGTQQFTPQGSDSKKFSALDDEAANAYAMAPGAEDTDFSAQSIVTGQAPPKTSKGAPGTVKPGTSVRDPQQLPRGMPTKKTKMAGFQPIARQWIDLMTSEEQKHGLPSGTLLTLYGMENGGGSYFGNNPQKAYGIFQFTKQLRDRYKISDEDAMNPAVMIPRAAENLRYNADKLAKLTGQPLPNTAAALPYWTALHQWGEGDGIRIVATAIRDHGHMRADEVMLPINGRDNGTVLKRNNLDPNITVADVIRDQATRGTPYHTAAIKVMDDPDTYSADETATPQQPAGGYTNVGPLRAAAGVNVAKVVPAAQRAINAIQALYPSVQVTSGYRGPGHKLYRPSSQHSQPGYSTAVDISLRGLSDAQKTDVVERARLAGAKGIGNYGGDMIHIDWRGNKAAWGPDKTRHSLGRTQPWFQQVVANHMKGTPPRVMDNVAATPAQPMQQPAQPAPTKAAAAAAPAAATQVQAQAQAQVQPAAYQPTPMEAAPEQAAATAAMFGVGAQPSLATMRRSNIRTAADKGFGEPVFAPLTRTSQLGPIRDAAIGNEYAATPKPSLGPIMDAATGNEFDSSRSAPLGPIVDAATANEFDTERSAPLGPIQDAATGNEFAPNPKPFETPSNIPAVSWQGSPFDQATRQTANAKQPSWEDYPDVPPATATADAPQLPMPDIAQQPPEIVEAQRMMASQEYPFPDDVPMPDASSATANMPALSNVKTPQELAAPPPSDEYNLFNREARARRAALAKQGAGEAWEAAKSAIFAIPDKHREMTQPPTDMSPQTQEAIDAAKQLYGQSWDRLWSELDRGRNVLRELPSQLGAQLPTTGIPQPQQNLRIQQFFDAVKEWTTNRDAPIKVKTINPVAPDPSSTKPNTATSSKQHPTARMPQGEQADPPLVLKPKPSTAYVPFQGNVPGQPTAPITVPPMATKPGTMPGATGATSGAGTVQRVGPGQFIIIPPQDPNMIIEQNLQQEPQVAQ